ncbi:unnamed protein product, partial [Ectocarpus sp. 12 AP-2014]
SSARPTWHARVPLLVVHEHHAERVGVRRWDVVARYEADHLHLPVHGGKDCLDGQHQRLHPRLRFGGGPGTGEGGWEPVRPAVRGFLHGRCAHHHWQRCRYSNRVRGVRRDKRR